MYDIEIPKETFNHSFMELLDCIKRYMVIYGGAGSGKSFYVAQRYIYKILTKKCNLLVVRNTARSNRDSTFALLSQIIYSWGLDRLFTINKGDLRIRCINGNEIIFAGLDDVEKLKSITFSLGELTDIWIEEASEISEHDFNQLDIRLRGKGTDKQIVLTFNPIDVNHWLKKRFIDVKSDDILVHHSTYKDNEHLDADYKKLLESYKDTDPYYYDVYCLGHWGVLGGCVFDANAISNRLRNLPFNSKVGYFTYDYDGLQITNIKWVESSNGYITMYFPPKKNIKYVIGTDTSGGVGGDYFVSQVHDQNGNQVATFRSQLDSDLCTKQTYCLGKYYNNALLTIEVNFDSFPIQEMQRLGYFNMYLREVNDTALDKHKKAYGFRTDSWTRPAILNHLIEIVREHTEFFNDKLTLEEMLTFVRNEKGRMEAQNGSHDDLVMAEAIAFEGMSQLRISKEKPKKKLDRFNDDPEFETKKGFDDYWG